MAEISYKAPFTKGVNFTEWLEFKTPEQIDRDWFTRTDFEHARALGADVVRLEEKEGIRGRVKIMVGGAPVSQAFADRIGADAYTPDAASAADTAVKLLQKD